MIRIHGPAMLVSLALCVLTLRAQQMEQDRLRPNRFLYPETSERKDLLQKYYESLLLERAKGVTPRVAGTDEESLLRQLRPGISFEGPINPSEYIVGPGDGLNINVWSGVPLSFHALVTPEGTLIIPTVGEVRVAGHSMKQVKEIVAREVRKKYAKGDVTVTLISPRNFLVNVAGVVNRPGAYAVSALDRVDKAVYLANLLTVTQLQQLNPLKQIEKETFSPSFPIEEDEKERRPSLRNIRLLRANGDSIQVDLIRYYATGDPKYNPYLLDGDVIVVPTAALSANAVSIWGAVRIPGRFEYRPGDSLSLMFKIANGPQAVADLSNTELVRFNSDGRTFERQVVDARKVLDGSMDIRLQPNDRVFVRSNRHLREEYHVTIVGEVRQPGMYAITRDSTWLSEIIEQAGGFTPEAAVAECKIIRKPGSEDPLAHNPDYERLTEMRLSGLNREGRDYFNYEAAIKRGYVSVDFKKLFLEGVKSADVTLRNGDFIIVPVRSKTVYVYGQVANPGHVTYVPGLPFSDYIEKAGGYSKAANKGKVFLIKAGTKKWVSVEEEPVEEGDAIFVSLRSERDLAYYFSLARDVLTVATATATIYLLIDQARR